MLCNVAHSLAVWKSPDFSKRVIISIGRVSVILGICLQSATSSNEPESSLSSELMFDVNTSLFDNFRRNALAFMAICDKMGNALFSC